LLSIPGRLLLPVPAPAGVLRRRRSRPRDRRRAHPQPSPPRCSPPSVVSVPRLPRAARLQRHGPAAACSLSFSAHGRSSGGRSGRRPRVLLPRRSASCLPPGRGGAPPAQIESRRQLLRPRAQPNRPHGPRPLRRGSWSGPATSGRAAWEGRRAPARWDWWSSRAASSPPSATTTSSGPPPLSSSPSSPAVVLSPSLSLSGPPPSSCGTTAGRGVSPVRPPAAGEQRCGRVGRPGPQRAACGDRARGWGAAQCSGARG
ncbi:unnamed protein product, partial [Urochloa humidicola]